MRAALLATSFALCAMGAVTPAPARAAGPLGLDDCATVEGVHQCSGIVATWDGVPLDTTVTLPAANARGLPLVALIHGFGNSKAAYLDPAERAYTDNAYAWARDGYAVLTFTARGLWGSCGTPEARLARPDECARGYIHLADTRYEVRDIQELIGRLVDEGVADPRRIGATGDSYGGGQSLALAALRDRVMAPDGSLVPWRSPAGTPLRLAAAAPVIPWSDLVGAIAPNGRTRHDVPTRDASVARPVGVFKTSVANAIFAAGHVAIGPGQPVGEPFVRGRPMGWFAPPGLDPQADVAAWVARADAGEPYSEPYILRVIRDLQRFRSAYGIDASVAPAPLLIAAGFTDDLFPAAEALRYAQRMRRQHPDVPLSLIFGDFGHQRASNKAADRERLIRAIRDWFQRHVRGDGPPVPEGVLATTQTCPRDAPSEGPFVAPSFARLATGSFVFMSTRRRQVLSTGGDPQVALAIDPATGGGDGCVRTTARDWPGTASYRLAPAPAGGTLMMGAPRVSARVRVRGRHPQLAARLWDVAPDGTQMLVARALVRPSRAGPTIFELGANGWRFEAGHVPRLELVGADPPFGRPSNGAFAVTVERLRLALPTR